MGKQDFLVAQANHCPNLWWILRLQVSKKYVSKEVCSQIHAKVAPFIKWLKEAEEEESSEEEEEEEVEVVYDTKAQQLKAQVDNTAPAEDDDDLDIDAI